MKDPTVKFSGTITPGQEKFARIISILTHPPIIAIPTFLLLGLLIHNIADQIISDVICLLFALVIPFGVTYYYSVKHDNRDGDIYRREDRYIPLAAGIVSYLVGTVILYVLAVPKIISVLMLCYAVNTFVVLLISTRWKISIHAIGIVGPSMALDYAFPPFGRLMIVLLPFIVWSRYVQKKHTPAQLAAGALVGFVLTGLIFIILL